MLREGKGHIPHIGKIIEAAPGYNRQIIAAGRPAIGIQGNRLLDRCQITIGVAAQHKSCPYMKGLRLPIIYIKCNALKL